MMDGYGFPPGVIDTAVVPLATSTGPALGVLIESPAPLRASDLRGHLARSLPVWSRPRVIALMIGLDLLPWPWGEDMLARLFAVVALVRGSRRRPSLAWASQQPGGRGLRLALAVCAFRGRWVARSTLLGVRSPGELIRRAVIRGEEYLAAGPKWTILLGFHLGPPNVDVTLRILGRKLAWLGSSRNSWVWSSEAWRPLSDPRENLAPPGDEWFWPGYLYRARRILLDGGALFIMADSWVGREAIRVPLPGGPMIICPAG
jgi:hypothetical protein